MTLKFQKEVYNTIFRDPREHFELREATSEIRYDPISGEMTRVFPLKHFQFAPHDWSKIVEESRERFCPFCPKMVENSTPMFPRELVPEGRLRHGKAIVVPNLSPYSAYAGIAILGTEHYLPLKDIPTDLVVDGLKAGISFLNIVKEYDPDKGRYGSIGWNYMPYSGGSIIHPHLQVLAGPVPSNTHRALLEGSRKYFQQYGINGWDQLVATEKNLNERYLWQSGSQHWLATFAPRGIGDITIVFEGKTSLADLTANDLKDFAVGLQRIFGYYDSIHLPSFNMALYPTPEPTPDCWLTARIVGRFTIFNHTSDISSLQMLFGDFNSIISPEQIAAEITKR